MAEIPETDIVFDNFKCIPSEMIDNIVVHSSDIDFNHHTNNIAYVRYISNQYSIKERIKMPVNAIEIQYVNQTFEGDNLEIYRCSENTFSIQSNGKTVVNCIIKM